MEENSQVPPVDDGRRPERPSRARNQRQMLITILVTILVVLIIYRTGVLKSIGFAPDGHVATSKSAKSSKSSKLSKVLAGSSFSIKYPANWKKLNSKGLAAFKNEFITGIIRNKPPAFMGIKIKAVSGKASTLKNIPAVLDKILAKDLNHFKRLKADIITINDKPALKYVYTFTSKKKLAIEQQQYIILNGKKAYYILFHMKISDADKLGPEIESIANSFLIK